MCKAEFGAGITHVTPDVTTPKRLRVALDATPLLGHQTGVGVFARGALAALGARPDLDVRAFAVSWRRRHGIADQLPPGVTVSQKPMPARPLHAAWARSNRPPIEWFIGTGRRGARDQLRGAAHPPSRRGGVGARPDPDPLSRAVQ